MEKEITEFVNKRIRHEHGKAMRDRADKLVDTGIDSFGITMVILELEMEYGILTDEQLARVEIEELTLGDIIDMVLDENRKLSV